mgnify:CR=1 FL=1
MVQKKILKINYMKKVLKVACLGKGHIINSELNEIRKRLKLGNKKFKIIKKNW